MPNHTISQKIETDGDRITFAEELTEKDKFHLKSHLLDKQKREMVIGKMMLNSEQTLPSMLGTIKSACQSFSLITPLHLLRANMMQL